MRRWLLAAVILVSLATWLIYRAYHKALPPHVNFRHKPSLDEQQRTERRLTLPPLPSPTPDQTPLLKRDPVLTALPTTKGKSVIVFEASSLAKSPLADVWLNCLLSKQEREEVELFKNEYGIDILQDLDRVAMSSERVVVVSGDFRNARWNSIYSEDHRNYGAKGMILSEGGMRNVAVWDQNLLIVTKTVALLEAAIDRVDGKVPWTPPVLPEGMSYGDVYGLVTAEDLAEWLPPSQHALADRLRQSRHQVELHVDVADDVSIMANVVGPGKPDVADFSKALGAALSVGRWRAQTTGDIWLAMFLKLAQMIPSDGRFTMELALSPSVIQQSLGPCWTARDVDGGQADD